MYLCSYVCTTYIPRVYSTYILDPVVVSQKILLLGQIINLDTGCTKSMQPLVS